MLLKKYLVFKQTLVGISFPNLVRLLSSNRIKFNFITIIRVLYLFITTFILYPWSMLETLLYRTKIKTCKIHQDPIFIIGHWRTGTTYLHNLLSLDSNFGYVSTFQAIFPSLFILGDKFLKPILKLAMLHTRPMDDVAMDPDFPQEEEFAIANLSIYSFYHGLAFPKSLKNYFYKFVLFKNCDKKSQKNWLSAYSYFIRKITLYHRGKRLILKNPANSARIKLLLELYPNSKFIYMFRNPFEVYCSTIKLYDNLVALTALQEIGQKEFKKDVLEFYPRLLDKYTEDKKYIPKENIIEVSYEKLVENPFRELSYIYEAFRLPDFNKSKQKFINYIRSQSNYEASNYTIDIGIRNEIESFWLSEK